jgi:hypothetical protein
MESRATPAFNPTSSTKSAHLDRYANSAKQRLTTQAED